METVEVTLPGGFAAGGGWHRAAALRPLAGRDEAFLLDEARGLLPAARTTALLARCLVRLGPLHPVAPEAVDALTVGDREALLLHLRRLALGDRLSCVLACPRCAETLDLDLRVDDLLVPPYERETDLHEAWIAADGARYLVRFRLPTGADQDAASALARADERAAVDLILHRCVHRVACEDGAPLDALPPAVAAALPALMVGLDPQAETLLRLTCPACDETFDVLLDAGEHLCAELRARGDDLFREVHELAFHYHWSEAEIMAMPPARRRRYLGLLADALGRRSA